MNTQSYGWEDDDSFDWSDEGDWSDWSDIDLSGFVAIQNPQFVWNEEKQIKEEDISISEIPSIDSSEKN